MSLIFYKVIFRGASDLERSDLSLTFSNIHSEKYINITNFITKLKSMSEKNENVINFQNIDEIIIKRVDNHPLSLNYHIVILITYKNEKKEGYLIGNTKKLGDLLIGIWPFAQKINEIQSEIIMKKLNRTLDNFDYIEKISIIYT